MTSSSRTEIPVYIRESHYHVDAYVSYEPGMVSGYEYYTGIIFAGYTFGSGEPILKGGRYDKLLSHFGKNAASIGFVIVVDQLMSSLGRQGIEAEIPYQGEVIVYVRERFREAAARDKRRGIHCGYYSSQAIGRTVKGHTQDKRFYVKQQFSNNQLSK